MSNLEDLLTVVLESLDNLEDILKGYEVDFPGLDTDRRKKSVIMAVHCCLNGPVGVDKVTNFPLIEGQMKIKTVVSVSNRGWKAFCLVVAGVISDDLKNGSWIFQKFGYVWPEPAVDKFFEEKAAERAAGRGYGSGTPGGYGST